MTRFLAIVSVLAIGSAVSAAAQQVSEQDAQQAGGASSMPGTRRFNKRTQPDMRPYTPKMLSA
jgi:hypothetical protein